MVIGLPSLPASKRKKYKALVITSPELEIMAGYNNYKSFVFYGQQAKCNYWIEVEQDILLVGCRANNEIIERSAAGPSRPELAPGEMAARTPRRLGTKNPLSLQIEHDPFREIVSRLIRIGWADQKLEFVRLASSWDGHAPFLLSNMCRRQLDERKKKGKYYEVQQSKQIVIAVRPFYIFSKYQQLRWDWTRSAILFFYQMAIWAAIYE